MVSHTDQLTYSLMDISGEKHITGSSNNLYSDVLTAIKLLAAGRVLVGPIITHRVPLTEVSKGFDILLDRSISNALKVIVLP